jgi:hypothetical protein
MRSGAAWRRSGRWPVTAGLAALPSGSGWDCTQASRSGTRTATSEWTFTGRRGSRQLRMGVRWCCRTRPGCWCSHGCPPGCRSVTLDFTGGVGKTRLALAAAASLAEAFPHGVFFIANSARACERPAWPAPRKPSGTRSARRNGSRNRLSGSWLPPARPSPLRSGGPSWPRAAWSLSRKRSRSLSHPARHSTSAPNTRSGGVTAGPAHLRELLTARVWLADCLACSQARCSSINGWHMSDLPRLPGLLSVVVAQPWP